MIKKGTIALYGIAILIVVFGIWYYFLQGQTIIGSIVPTDQWGNFILVIIITAVLVILYKVGSLMIKGSIMKSQGSEGEIVMIQGVFKFIVIIAIILVLITAWVSIGTLGSLFITFSGMFLGWSLQSPISGIAAWFLVSIVRPFRIGDRVQLPSQGLVGDVVGISPLYTTLNQVGGSVGSEEPANRTILIPNAQLFSLLIINYTPKHQEELIEQSRSMAACSQSDASAYMLDEYVFRLSFDSDWDEAEKILLDAAKEVTAEIIKETGEEPYLRADYSDWYGVFLRLRFLTMATQRPKIIYEISKRVFKAVQVSTNVDMAIPYIYSYRKGMNWGFPPGSIQSLDRDRVIEETIKTNNMKFERIPHIDDPLVDDPPSDPEGDPYVQPQTEG
jgi:small-conductance mechanosensitive channel